jgi:hypothetical protein
LIVGKYVSWVVRYGLCTVIGPCEHNYPIAGIRHDMLVVPAKVCIFNATRERRIQDFVGGHCKFRFRLSDHGGAVGERDH